MMVRTLARVAVPALALDLCAQVAAAQPVLPAGGGDVALAQAFRPVLNLAKAQRCFPLSYQEIKETASSSERDGMKKRCNKAYNPGFVVSASVKRPSDAAPPNTFRVTYGVSFGWQNGTFTGLTQDLISLFADAGDHGEDAQYLVADVVGGSLVSVWADLHKGYYARVRSQLTVREDAHVTAWAGAYYNSLKLVEDRSSVCSVWNSVPSGLQALCGASCKLGGKSCGEFDTLMNFGDPLGDAHQGMGKLVMVEDACKAGDSYTSPDGVTYKGTQLAAMKGYIGCSGASTPGAWSGYFMKKAQYTDPYGLGGCKSGDKSGGDICNASVFAAGATWQTRAGQSVVLDPTVVGSADVDYVAGAPFNDIDLTASAAQSITLRGGKRVDAVSVSYVGKGASHGGNGGSSATLDNLAKDPVVAVTLCEASKDGRPRAGHLQLRTAAGRTLAAGTGKQGCKQVAPAGMRLVGFYGRSGSEVDVLGTIWARR